MLDSKNYVLLTNGVMAWKKSWQDMSGLSAKILTGHVRSIITTQALPGCQNSHYTTEKGKASELRKLNVARSEVLHYGGGGGGGGVVVVVVCVCVCVCGGGGGHIQTITLTSMVSLFY